MAKPDSTWFDMLPKNRLMAEFSMWSADLVRIADDLARISSHADLLHIDVADGHFLHRLCCFSPILSRGYGRPARFRSMCI